MRVGAVIDSVLIIKATLVVEAVRGGLVVGAVRVEAVIIVHRLEGLFLLELDFRGLQVIKLHVSLGLLVHGVHDVLADVESVGDLAPDQMLDDDQLGVDGGQAAEVLGDFHDVAEDAAPMALQERQGPSVPELGYLDFVGDRAAAVVDGRADAHGRSHGEFHAREGVAVQHGQVALHLARGRPGQEH